MLTKWSRRNGHAAFEWNENHRTSVADRLGVGRRVRFELLYY